MFPLEIAYSSANERILSHASTSEAFFFPGGGDLGHGVRLGAFSLSAWIKEIPGRPWDEEGLLQALPVAAVIGTDSYHKPFLLQRIHIAHNCPPGHSGFLCQSGSGFCDIFCVIEGQYPNNNTLSFS